MQLANYLSKLKHSRNIRNPFSQQKIFEFYTRKPALYLTTSCIFALLGYIYLLFLPALTIYLPFIIYNKIQIVQHLQGWFDLLLLLSIFFGLCALGISLIVFKFKAPVGMELNRSKVPLLFKDIDSIREYYGGVKIHRVLLDDGNSIRVTKRPGVFLPMFCTNTIIIGLPMLQCTSKDYFQAKLTSAIGKLSGKDNFIISKLFFLTHCWQQYIDNCRTRKSIAFTLLRLYLSLYSKLYDKLIVGIKYKYNLETDNYALDLINHSDTIKSIAYDHIFKNYLIKNYWPKVNEMMSSYSNPCYSPYTNMRSAVCNGIEQYDLQAVIDLLLQDGERLAVEIPTFQERLDYLGANKGLVPSLSETNHAQQVLGPTYPFALKVLDAVWVNRFHKYSTMDDA